MSSPIVYLIPSVLDTDAIQTIPPYVLDAVKECQVFFVENERTARRFLKSMWKEMVIDNYKWFEIQKQESAATKEMIGCIKEGNTIGIISEAGCPGVADPGQMLIDTAHRYGATIRPLVGPNSILLALMGSGLNGQQFQFVGYLPIDNTNRAKAIRQLEEESLKKNCTQLFIETPYRNNQLIETLLKTLKPNTRLCIAANITGRNEFIKTKTISDWKKQLPDLHKQPAIFCMLAGS